METCKVVPAFMRRFRFELTYPDQEWEILNYTFLKPRAVDVFVVQRERH